MHKIHWVCLSICLLAHLILFPKAEARDYQASKASVAPEIDGSGNDACWKLSFWNNIDQTWLGTPPTATDFSGRFKLCWDKDKLYLLGEITDDSLSDHHSEPFERYWDDDAFEILLDEDQSGGEHQYSYNAFAYHISALLDVVDVDTDGSARLFNDHIKVKMTRVGNVFTWECAITIYPDSFEHGSEENTAVELTEGKKLGFALAYCDNDGGSDRQNFMGSEEVGGEDKNVAYKDASIFGTVTLVERASPPEPSFSQIPIANGLRNPTVMVCADDGRIFVCEQEGALRVIDNQTLVSEPVLEVTTEPVGTYSERGLIGLAIDPDFAENQFIYIYYTATDSFLHNRVTRFTLEGNKAIPGSDTILLELDPLGNSVSHNGGAMTFGLDGKLYIATGDNQLPDVPRVSQDLTTTHGKILRINKDGSIPEDNPFISGEGRSNLVWSYGLRNPFTFDIHSKTGTFFINDVGQEAWEEVNDATAPGLNFGWPGAEGNSDDPAFANPVYQYRNTLEPSDSLGCAITGGVFFNPSNTNYPVSLSGKYFFMDYCNNWINYIDPENNFKRNIFLTNTSGGPVAIDVGIDGNLYYLSRVTSSVIKIIATASPIPVIVKQPEPLKVFGSQPATFSVIVTGEGPLSFQWMKDSVAIEGANSEVYTIPETKSDDAGSYHVIVTNALESVSSDTVVLEVGPVNHRPVAVITSPEKDAMYSAGNSIAYSGTATDEEDGELDKSAFTWFIDFYHDRHVHNAPPVSGITEGSFVAGRDVETDHNVWYRITLVVKDKSGLTDTAIVDINPDKSVLTFTTEPPGLKIELEGQPIATPVKITSVRGVLRSLSALSPQNLGGKTYMFDRWSHGGDSVQNIFTPPSDVSFKAIFKSIKQDTVVIDAIHDAYVQDGTQNAGDEVTPYGLNNPTELVAKTYLHGPNREIFVMFNISEFTDSIQKAELRLWGRIEETPDSSDYILVALLQSRDTLWREKEVTWKTKPVITGKGIDTIQLTGFERKKYIYDITDYLRRERAAGRSNLVFGINVAEDEFSRIYFDSKESVVNSGPQLFIIPHYQVQTFSGKVVGGEVNLQWTTKVTEGYKKFVIQRSVNKKRDFIDLDTIPANESGIYTYTDANLTDETYYYRIKVINADDRLTYNEPIYIETFIIGVMNPEAEAERLFERLTNKFGPDLKWTFSNILGQEVMMLENPHPNHFLDYLRSGIYILKVSDNNDEIIYTGKMLISK